MFVSLLYMPKYIHHCAFTVDSSKPHTMNERECERGERTRDKANQTNVHMDTNTVPWLNESNETISIREKQNPPNAVSSLLLLLLRSHGSRNFNDDCSLYAHIHIYVHTHFDYENT